MFTWDVFRFYVVLSLLLMVLCYFVIPSIVYGIVKSATVAYYKGLDFIKKEEKSNGKK